MVFRGRPSRGCERCRKAAVKCDQQRPACARCQRLHQECEGYRIIDDLLILDETAKVSATRRASQLERRIRKPTLSTPRLDSSGGDSIVWYFYYGTKATLTPIDHSYQLHTALPGMYCSSAPESALVLAAQAVSHASGCRIGISKVTAARRSYSAAIAALGRALQDPLQVQEDDTLYAALLLSGYETIVSQKGELHDWAVHVRGIAALLVNRSTSAQRTPFAIQMHYFARRSVLLYQLQAGKIIFSGTIKPNTFEHCMANEADRLFEMMSRLSTIRDYLTKTNKTALNVGLFLSQCDDLEQDLINWKCSLPPEWIFTVKHRLLGTGIQSMTDIYVPAMLHEYRNAFVARVWNLYRTCRVILCTTKAHVNEVPYAHTLAPDCIADSRFEHVAARVLVDDICASVEYFYTGEDQESSSGPQHGRYSLLWPLHVCSASQSIPPAQRKWMKAQILRLARSGEVPLAARIYDQDSQILAGGQEPIFFDCV